jgi:hypothetical protein
MFSLSVVSDHCFRSGTAPLPGKYELNTTP